MEFAVALARARSWISATGTRPDPMTAKAVAEALVQRLDEQEAEVAAQRARIMKLENQLARAIESTDSGESANG